MTAPAGNGSRALLDEEVPVTARADRASRAEDNEPAIEPAWRGPRRRWLVAALGVAVVALLIGVAARVRWDSGRPGSEPPAPAPPGGNGEPPATGELVAFQDATSGVSISYPAGWQRLDTTGSDPAVRLVVSDGGLNSLLVRVVTLEAEITRDNLADINTVTDGIITSGGATVLQEQAVELNGLPGYYYLYLFNDPETGQQGVHAHYFLFNGRTMNVLVFQVVPLERFGSLASTFDAVVASFKSEPPAAPPPSTPPSPGG